MPGRTRAQCGAAAGAGLAALALTACGSGSSEVVRTPPAPSTTSSALSSGASSSAWSAPQGKPAATVSPAKGLRDRQIVTVTANGFTPAEPLQLVECADKGTKTGPGDCNLTGMVAVTADSAGRVVAQIRVLRGPFGASKIVCGPAQSCLLSVTQASLAPTEEADVPIEFAAS